MLGLALALPRSPGKRIGSQPAPGRDAESFVARAQLAATSGDAPLAIARFDSAVMVDSSYLPAYLGRGGYYSSRYSREANDSAIMNYAAAIRIDSGNAQAYRGRGFLYLRRGDTVRAVKDLQAAVAVSGPDDPLVDSTRKILTGLGGPRPDSILSRIVAVAPHVPILFYGHGDDQAVAALFRALQQNRGWRVKQPERVEPDAVNTAEKYAGVKFYFEADRALAQSVCEAAVGELARQGFVVTLPVTHMVEGAFPGVARGLVEVWISPLPAAARSPQQNRLAISDTTGCPRWHRSPRTASP